MATPSAPARSPAQLWLVGGLLVIVFAILAGAYFLLTRPTMAVLAKDLRPADAAAIVAELDAEGATYELRDEGSTILAPANEVDQLRLKIATADLPIRGLDGFELFDNSDLGLTDFAQRIKYQRAIQGELARTIMKIEGVVEARVHISMPERSIFKGEREPAKAAVTMSVRKPFSEIEGVEGVQELVAAAIPDLTPGEVVVLNARGQIISHKQQTVAHVPAQIASDLNEDDPLLAAVQGALPGRSIRIERIEAAPSAVENATPAQATLQVATYTALNIEEQQRTRQAITATHGDEDPIKISFVVTPPPVVFPLPQVETVTAVEATSVSQEPETWRLVGVPPETLVLVFGGALALILAAALFFFVQRSRHSLTRDDQRRLADRLKLSLETPMEETVDAR